MKLLPKEAPPILRNLSAPLIRFFKRYPPIDNTPSARQPNPFLPVKNKTTGCWRGPVYSLRRQADLIKEARINGLEELMPPTLKQVNLAQGIVSKPMRGLLIRKGHKHEREKPEKLRKRKVALKTTVEKTRKWRQFGKWNRKRAKFVHDKISKQFK